MTDPIETRPKVTMRQGEEKRLATGHPWAFSNEIEMDAAAKALPPGELVTLLRKDNRTLGVALFNPHSLIAARVLSRDPTAEINARFFERRLQRALKLRERLVGAPFYRLAHAEADGFPGAVIDRFGDVVVVELNSAGMDRLAEPLAEAIDKVLNPATILLRGEGSARGSEGLEPMSRFAKGGLDGPITVEENGARFLADLGEGQKTGWFYDQRENRAQLARLAGGKRVLDVFSYAGAWGLRAASFGASEVVCVDASQAAIDAIGRNAERNGLAERVRATRADAFEYLKALREARERFDVVILDPPAFAKRKKDLAEGRLAYRRLNELGMQVLEKDGILVTCSCSFHMPRAALLESVQQGARHLDRQAQALISLQQAPDHPVHPAIPETDYLKGFVVRVLPS